MRAFILGAGASRGYQSPTGQLMPLARDFFDVFQQLDIAADPWVLQQGLSAYLLQEKGVDPYAYLGSGIDIEELHSEIADHFIRTAGQPRINRLMPLKTYHELIFLFACTINTVQNGPVSPIHQQLADSLQARDILITFNWDTLLDRALHRSQRWSVDSGYGVQPIRVFRDGWHDPRRGVAGEPRLLKLHGSTNWLTAHPVLDEHDQMRLTQAIGPEQFCVFERSQGPFDTFAGRWMEGYGEFTYVYYPPNLDVEALAAPEGHTLLRGRLKLPWMPEGTSGDAGLASIPLIIPPVKDKTYDLFGDLFGSIWKQAEQALTSATEIVLIGYSFPRTDHRSNDLFKSAFLKRDSLPIVRIVDPYPGRVAEKFSFEFGIPEHRLQVIEDKFTPESLAAVTRARN